MTTGASVRAAGVFLGGDFAEGVVGRYGRRPPSFTVPQIPAIKYSMNAARTHTLREHGPPRLPSSLPSPPSKKRAEALLSPAPKPPTTHHRLVRTMDTYPGGKPEEPAIFDVALAVVTAGPLPFRQLTRAALRPLQTQTLTTTARSQGLLDEEGMSWRPVT